MGGADDHYGSQIFAGGTGAFFGGTPVAQQTVAQQTTLTTTQLRAELTALQNALAAYNLIDVT